MTSQEDLEERISLIACLLCMLDKSLAGLERVQGEAGGEGMEEADCLAPRARA